MLAGSERVVALRRLIDERYPAARPRTARQIATGVPALDLLLGGGLRTGTLTEFISSAASTGSQTSLGALLAVTRASRQRIALIDAAGAFDIEGFDDDLIAHLVWVQCTSLSECWRAADLVARDPNYAAVVIDVRGQPVRELMRTKDSVWIRLQRAAEQAETTILIQSDTAIVPNATVRVAFIAPLPTDAHLAPRHDIVRRIAPEVQRVRTRQNELTA